MAQTFSCPNCGAPLDYAGDGQPTIRCPYCSNSVIVPQELRYQKSEPVPSQVSMSLMGQAGNLQELARLTRMGQKEEAVKLYQQIFGVGEWMARQAVDSMTASSTVVVTGTPLSYNIVTTGYGGQPIGSTVTVNTPTATLSRKWAWAIGCFIAGFVILMILTTVIPIILGVIGALIPFFIR